MRIVQHRHSGKMALQHRHSEIGYLPVNDQWKVRDDITVEFIAGGIGWYLIKVKGTQFATVSRSDEVIGCLTDDDLWENWIKGEKSCHSVK